jgi:very-short-patch-repair endonuclease
MRTSLNPRLAEFAKDMRRNPTEAEKRLWRCLSGKQLGGLKFRRQVPVLVYILDFYCPEINLAIEIDGDTHKQSADNERDAQLGSLDVVTLRFTNSDILTNIAGVLESILVKAEMCPRRQGWRRPTPTPPQEGRG